MLINGIGDWRRTSSNTAPISSSLEELPARFDKEKYYDSFTNIHPAFLTSLLLPQHNKRFRSHT
jgi:hypothetical protein